MDEFGNTILHLAAINSNNKLIDYISKNVKIDMFARNKAGETALSICQNLKNAEGIKTLGQYQTTYDKSDAIAKDLLDELNQEEENEEEAKNKKR
jgi:ankyrin repeat protein